MNSYYENKGIIIYHGDCREVLPTLSKASAIVTDPPYELGFMGKSWDSKGISFQKETWGIVREACLSGAMLLSFGGTRTFHRIACAIEDAGWEYRDTLMWVYGSGFPKSLDISKAVDKQFGVEREIIYRGEEPGREGRKSTKKMPQPMDWGNNAYKSNQFTVTKPATPEAQLWEGYGTALKPAYEPIILAMNPLDGTFANNALKHGVAGLNIDECRIETNEDQRRPSSGGDNGLLGTSTFKIHERKIEDQIKHKGRFPANFIHDGSQMVMELFPNSKGAFAPVRRGQDGKSRGIYGDYAQKGDDGASYYGDNGSAARFFYCAKSSRRERDRGLEGMPLVENDGKGNLALWCKKCDHLYDPHRRVPGHCRCEEPEIEPQVRKLHPSKNNHPTVKPLSLVTYLVKLVKMPEYNLVIDSFMGSGTTLLACIRLGIPCIGIDNDEKSCEIATRRCQSINQEE